MVEYLTVFSHVGFFIWFFQQALATGVTIMSGKTDVVKGRIKEAAGVLTGNDKLRARARPTKQSARSSKSLTRPSTRSSKP